MKTLAFAFLMSAALPLLADDAVVTSPPSAKDLKALDKITEAQKTTKAPANAPVVNISGYAETSYTKALTGSNSLPGTACTKGGSSLTTEKVSVNATFVDKNGFSGGIQVDAIHCSSK